MRPSKFSIPLYIYNEFRDNAGVDPDLPVIVNFDAYPGDPGRLSGPPEKCYPPEPPEIEIFEILSKETLRSVVVSDRAFSALESDCWEFLNNLPEPEPDFDDYEAYVSHFDEPSF